MAAAGQAEKEASHLLIRALPDFGWPGGREVRGASAVSGCGFRVGDEGICFLPAFAGAPGVFALAKRTPVDAGNGNEAESILQIMKANRVACYGEFWARGR